MKKKTTKIIFTVLAVLIVVSVGIGGYFWWNNANWPGEPVQMQMHVDFPKPQNLADGNGERVKVILLMGQSNATGIGYVEYLQKNTTPEQYAKYENGFDSVLINFSLDNNTNSSNGEFVNVDLNCSIWPGTVFGPEVGMAEKFSKEWGDEKVIILKYTYSGTCLYTQWLAKGERGSIYGAMQKFVDTYMSALHSKGYNAYLGAICWMQGESDAGGIGCHKRYRYRVVLSSAKQFHFLFEGRFCKVCRGGRYLFY